MWKLKSVNVKHKWKSSGGLDHGREDWVEHHNTRSHARSISLNQLKMIRSRRVSVQARACRDQKYSNPYGMWHV